MASCTMSDSSATRGSMTASTFSRWKETVCPTGWIDAIDEEQTLMHDAVYDLRTVPAIYLLDRNKRVLLKNAAPDEVGSWLSGR